jgi:hypothetical protein
VASDDSEPERPSGPLHTRLDDSARRRALLSETCELPAATDRLVGTLASWRTQ